MDSGGNVRYGDLYSVHTNKFEEIERYRNHKWDTFLYYEELPIKEHYKFGEIKSKYVIHMQAGTKFLNSLRQE